MASGEDQQKNVPKPENHLSLFERRAQSSVLFQDRLYFWGGIVVVTEHLPDDSSSEEDSDEDDTPFPTVQGIPPGVLRVRKNLPLTKKKLIDVYDIKEKLWYQYATTGEVPPSDYGAAMCELGGYIYLFGGYNDLHFSSDLYCLDPAAMSWKKKRTADVVPSPVYRTSLVGYQGQNCLIAFGGVCERIPGERLRDNNAEYSEYTISPHPYGSNNEYHVYDVTEGCWKIPQVIGRPGPRCGHSMVVVDKYRAAMFGGILGESAFSELYILDMETNTFHQIRNPNSPDKPWPLPRTFHPMCSLTAIDNDGDSDVCAQLFVLWGRDTKTTVADEAGMFTFNKGLTAVSYKKFVLPLVPRYWHTANAYCMKNSNTILIFVFGGNFPSNTERFGEIARCPKTGLRLWRGDFRILQLGWDFPTLHSLCMKVISANFSILSRHLLLLSGSSVLSEVEDYHRKNSYYPHIPLEPPSNVAGDGGCGSTQFLCGVGYGRAIPQR